MTIQLLLPIKAARYFQQATAPINNPHASLEELCEVLLTAQLDVVCGPLHSSAYKTCDFCLWEVER